MSRIGHFSSPISHYSSPRSHFSSPGRVSSTGIGGPVFDDYGDYDARRTAYETFMRDPGKYTVTRRVDDGRTVGTVGTSSRYRGHKGPADVVIEHRSGCTGKSVCEEIRESIKYNFPDVKVTENERGRYGSFEVFINGKILYSRIMQGGYPYVEEVLDAVSLARDGQEFDQLERGSASCNIL